MTSHNCRPEFVLLHNETKPGVALLAGFILLVGICFVSLRIVELCLYGMSTWWLPNARRVATECPHGGYRKSTLSDFGMPITQINAPLVWFIPLFPRNPTMLNALVHPPRGVNKRREALLKTGICIMKILDIEYFVAIPNIYLNNFQRCLAQLSVARSLPTSPI